MAIAYLNHALVAASMFTEPGKRSNEDYENEVSKYAKAYSQALLERCMWRLLRHMPICMRLEAVNLTEANFTDIVIGIHVPGDVRSWPTEFDRLRWGAEPELPKKPATLGTRKQTLPFSISDYGSTLIAGHNHHRAPSINNGPSFTIRDIGSVAVDFSGIDLRPEQRLKLPPVRLLVDAPEGTVLNCEWTATAGNVPRRLTGGFSLTVGRSALSFGDIEVSQKPNVDEGDN